MHRNPVIAAATKPTPTPRPEIRLAGDTGMYSLIRDMIDTYEKSRPAVAMRLEPEELRQDGITVVRSGNREIGLLALKAKRWMPWMIRASSS